MKKTILLIVLVFSLSANEIVCKMSKDGYAQQDKLMRFAYERKDLSGVKSHAKSTIENLERAMVYCKLTEKQMKTAVDQRLKLIKMLDDIKGK